MTTLVKCRFCCRNGHNEVAIPDGTPVRCTFCKRVQPITEKPEREPVERNAKPVYFSSNPFSNLSESNEN